MRREKPERLAAARVRVPMRGTGAEMPVVGKEGPVMGLDRRGVVIRLYPVGNPTRGGPA
jgi:hypothetical protein